jgi:hypothetical protein
MDEAREQYDKQLGELYKRNREKAVQLREQEASRKQKKGDLPSGQPDPNIQRKQTDFVTECKRWYDADPRPYRLGNYRCFFYNKLTNEPRLVLGPDWGFSLAEMLLINGVCGYFLYTANTDEHMILFNVGMLLLLFQNLAFLATVLGNPGLPPRDISVHSQSYLNKVKIFK